MTCLKETFRGNENEDHVGCSDSAAHSQLDIMQLETSASEGLKMTSCPYSEEELAIWDGVTNPMGDACYVCDECECEHWAGSCKDCKQYEKWPDCGGPQRNEYEDLP